MLKSVKQKTVRFLLALSIIFILIGTPTIPAAHADCAPASSGGVCTG